jgi:hypothetical protein
VERYVTNEEFDEWITASNWVIVPYSEIWSSGVLARTRLLNRPAIVSSVGGLPEQVSSEDLMFGDESQLVSSLQAAAARVPSTVSQALGL